MPKLSVPEFVTFQIIPSTDGNIIRTSYYGSKLTTEKAIDIINTLFSLWWNQAEKPLNQEFDLPSLFWKAHHRTRSIYLIKLIYHDQCEQLLKNF